MRRFKYSKEIHPNIFKITLPLFVEKPGPINSFLFIGDHITLLDVGPAFTARRLKKALWEHKIRFSDVEQIIISHGHPDHYGAAGRIRKKSGGKAKVAIHQEDTVWIATGSDAPAATYAAFYKLAGIPFSLRHIMSLFDKSYEALVRPLQEDLILNDGDEIMLGSYCGKILNTPGHSKGSICIYLEEQNILFPGDTILGHITPNPFVMFEKKIDLPWRLSQKEYYSSLARLEALSPTILYPAHGPSIYDLSALLEGYRKTYAQRQARILALIASQEQTVYQISRRLFPEIKDGVKLLLEIYPMISEVYTHIQVLKEDKKISSKINNRVMTFHVNE